MGTASRPSHAVTSALALTIIVAVVLLIRLPFLNQAIQGDDAYYLAGAQHAQIDPLHPNNVRYIATGDSIDLRGYPHPPFNAWFLGLLLAVMGDIREVPFHAAYILFSLIAALAMWSLARRFSPHPLWATLLFLAVPAFVINGNSLESDLPFLAFWMAALACFVAGKWRAAAVALVLASFSAYQAIFLTPILAVYVWLYRRHDRTAWALTLVPPGSILAWQLFERWSSGAVPAAVMSGYMSSYGLQALVNKLRSAAALTVHACFLVFPALLPGAVMLSWKRRDRDTAFLAAWIALFFSAALVVFFAGSARYLLPMAAPVALLVSRLRPKWLALGFAAQMALSLALAITNYQHWDGYRRFAAQIRAQTAGHRVYINGEWGLRFYVEADGGLPIERGQVLRPGDMVVSSRLAYPLEITAPVAPIAQEAIRAWLPLQLIGLEARSGYSTATKGVLPFDITTAPIDLVRADIVLERHPTLAYLPMNAPEARAQIVTGLYDLENGAWRWMSGAATVLLKSPAGPLPVEAAFNIPGVAPARRVQLLLDGREIASQAYSGPGSYMLKSPPEAPAGPTAAVTLTVDRTFFVPGDHRELGMVVSAIGFRR
jgi:4-amino-4-deoxy-L-arabinose transferase-like glycosyltransferase